MNKLDLAGLYHAINNNSEIENLYNSMRSDAQFGGMVRCLVTEIIDNPNSTDTDRLRVIRLLEPIVEAKKSGCSVKEELKRRHDIIDNLLSHNPVTGKTAGGAE